MRKCLGLSVGAVGSIGWAFLATAGAQPSPSIAPRPPPDGTWVADAVGWLGFACDPQPPAEGGRGERFETGY